MMQRVPTPQPREFSLAVAEPARCYGRCLAPAGIHPCNLFGVGNLDGTLADAGIFRVPVPAACSHGRCLADARILPNSAGTLPGPSGRPACAGIHPAASWPMSARRGARPAHAGIRRKKLGITASQCGLPCACRDLPDTSSTTETTWWRSLCVQGFALSKRSSIIRRRRPPCLRRDLPTWCVGSASPLRDALRMRGFAQAWHRRAIVWVGTPCLRWDSSITNVGQMHDVGDL